MRGKRVIAEHLGGLLSMDDFTLGALWMLAAAGAGIVASTVGAVSSALRRPRHALRDPHRT